MQKILTLDEVCEILTISVQTGYRLIKSGQIRAFKQGKQWRIPESSLEEYVERKLKENDGSRD